MVDAMPQPRNPATTLEYAPPLRWSRRRVVAGAIVLALALCAYGGWRWGPRLRGRVNLLTLQHRCLGYEAPPERIVFTGDPNDMDTLLRSDASYRSLIVPLRVRRMIAPNVRTDVTVRTKYVWYSSDAWMRFPAGRWEPAPAYLHRRVTPKGDERLIAVELSATGDDPLAAGLCSA